jgi:glycosyltransferase involved in cell wall biosynthesis
MIHYITSDGLGQPWVGNELRIVTGQGIPVKLHAIRAPGRVHFESPWAQRMAEQTRVLYPLPLLGMVVSVVLAPFLFGGRWIAAITNALFAPRENLRARASALAHFFVACHWAGSLRRETVAHIHSQWAYSSGSIGMYGSWLLGVPFSFTGHAADLFRDRVALRDKVHRAKFIICISEFHRKFFLENGARPEQLRIAYCGIDVEQMSPRPGVRTPGPYTILSSGRLVEKKGFEYLIDACGILRDRGADFRCIIAGSGPLEQALRQRVVERRLGDLVTITGKPIAQEAIPAFMHTGDVYVLACVWARDGDVDGLPQMTMEAMGCGVAAITTRLVGNPDLVDHERTGLLVEPNDAPAVADAIERLMKDPALADRLARSGREWVLQTFDIESSLLSLVTEYREALKAAGCPCETDTTASREHRDAASPAAVSTSP